MLKALTGALAAAVAVAAGAGTAAAAGPPSPVTIESTVVLDRTTFRAGQGNGVAQADARGGFIASGAFAGAGTESDLITFTGFNAKDSNVLHGATTFTGAGGTLTVSWQALHNPFEVPAFDGRWVIAGGTGAYEGLRGSGSVGFLVEGEETDFPVVHETWTGQALPGGE